MIRKNYRTLNADVMRAIRDRTAMLRGEYGLDISQRFGPIWAGGAILRSLVRNVFNPDVDNDIFVPESLWHKGLEGAEVHSLQPYVDVPHLGVMLSSKIPPFNFIQVLEKTSLDFENQVFSAFDFFACMVATDGKVIYGYEKAFKDIERKVLVLNKDYYDLYISPAADEVIEAHEADEYSARIIRQRKRCKDRVEKYTKQLEMRYIPHVSDKYLVT